MRIHGCIIHIDIIDRKLWIQRDSSEDGIALDLLAEGISEKEILKRFLSPKIREYSNFAVG